MSQSQDTLKTRGIKCEGCVANARAALEQLPGIEQVDFDLRGKTVTITHDQSVSRADVARALTAAGYPSE